jgi:hypothetical protein
MVTTERRYFASPCFLISFTAAPTSSLMKACASLGLVVVLTPSPEQRAGRQPVDERLDDQPRINSCAARAVHAGPSVSVIAPERRIRRRRPYVRRTRDFGFSADRTQCDDPFDCRALEPRACALGIGGFVTWNEPVGRDALDAAGTQFPHQLFFTGDPEVLVRANHQRRNLTAREAHARRFWGLPRRRELRTFGDRFANEPGDDRRCNQRNQTIPNFRFH